MLNKPWLHDAILFILRVWVGIVVGFQSYRIFFVNGIGRTADQLERWGMPSAQGLTIMLGIFFLLAAIGLILGILTPLFALIGAVSEALYLYYLINGGGFGFETSQTQMCLLLVVVMVSIAVLGAGRGSADGFLQRR